MTPNTPNNSAEAFKQQSLDIIRKLEVPGYERQWEAIIEQNSDKPESLKGLFKDYLQTLRESDPTVAEKIDQISADFMGDLEAIKGTSEKVEKEATKKESAPEKSSKAELQVAKKARDRRAYVREVKSEVRAVQKRFLQKKKHIYERLSNVGASEQAKLRGELADLDKESAEAQLAVYAQNGVDIKSPANEFRAEVEVLQRQVDSGKFADKQEKPPSLKELKEKMYKARKLMEETKSIEFDDADPPTIDAIQSNFEAVHRAQGNIIDVAAYLQASLKEAQGLVSGAHNAAEHSGIIDKISSWSWVPWKTDNARKVKEGNDSIDGIKAKIKDEFDPLISQVDAYKGKVVDAAEKLGSQTGAFYESLREDSSTLTERKDKAIEAKQHNEEVRKEQAEALKSKTLEDMKQEHEKHLALLRAQKKQVMEINDKQEKISEAQAAALKEHGHQLNQSMLTHDQAKQDVKESISALQSKLPGLSGEEKARAEEKIKLLQAKLGELDASKSGFDAKIEALGKAEASIVVANHDYRAQVFNAVVNLNVLENKAIVDYSQQLAGVRRIFAKAEMAASRFVAEDIEATEEAYNEKIAVAKDKEGMGEDLNGQAEILKLDIEVSNLETLDSISNAKNALAASQETSIGFLSAVSSSVLEFDWAWDAFGVSQDSKWRKYLSLNPLIAPFKLAFRGVEAGAGWLNENAPGLFGSDLTIAEWWDESIEIMKDVKIPVLNQLADFTAGVADFVVDLGGGAWQLVSHPIQSLSGIGDLIVSPSKWGEVGKVLIEYDEWGENTGYAAAKGVGNILLTLTGIGAGKHAATVASAVSKTGRLATYGARTGVFLKEFGVNLAKEMPLAVYRTGRFIITTPFKMAGRAGRLGLAAMKGEMASAWVGLTKEARLAKLGEISNDYGKLAGQMEKLTGGAVKVADLDAKIMAKATSLENARTLLNGMTASLDDVTKAKAALLLEKAYKLNNRINILKNAYGPLNAMQATPVASHLSAAEFMSVPLDDYVKMARKFKDTDELAVAIMSDSRLGLKMTSRGARMEAKLFAKLLLEQPRALSLRQHIARVLNPVSTDDLVKYYKALEGGSPEIVANLEKVQAVSGTAPVKLVKKALKSYLTEEPFVKAMNVDDLTREILMKWDEISAVKHNANMGLSKLPKKMNIGGKKVEVTSWFDHPEKIKAARAYAQEVWSTKQKTFQSLSPQWKAAVKGVDALPPVNVAETAKVGFSLTRRINFYRGQIQTLEGQIAVAGNDVVSAARFAKEIETIRLKIALCQAGKVHMLVTYPALRIGEWGGALVKAAGKTISVPIQFLGYTANGAIKMAVEGSKGLFRSLDLPKNLAQAKEVLKGTRSVLAEPRVFVAKNLDEMNVVLRSAIFAQLGLTKLEDRNGLDVEVESVKPGAENIDDKKVVDDEKAVDNIYR